MCAHEPEAPSTPVASSWTRLERDYLRIAEPSARDEPDARFLRGRLAEGRAIGEYLSARFDGRRIDVLDLGAGNGGVSVALANYPHLRVSSLDVGINAVWTPLCRTSSAVRLRPLVADAEMLPFGDAGFDVVLCLETLEHLPRPARSGAEIMRVLRTGGICMVTTPARASHLVAGDPHFHVPGLLLLPAAVQRWLVTKVLRRVDPTRYDVEHVFWYAGSIAKLFPGSVGFQAIDWGEPRWWPWLAQRVAWRRLVVEKAERPPVSTATGRR